MSIAERVRELIAEAEDDLGVFFHTAGKAVADNGGAELLSLVADAVQAAEQTGAPGLGKFNAAKTAIAEALVARGLPVVWNAIHLAIEATVAHMHAQAGVTGADHAPKAEPASLTPATDQNGTSTGAPVWPACSPGR